MWSEGYTVYAMANGERIDIENMSYEMRRETKPLFEMGTPMEWVPSHFRSITGDLTIASSAPMCKLRNEAFRIYIEGIKENTQIIIDGVYITSVLWINDEYHASFVANNLDTNELKKLEEMSNRELAKRLLTAEY
jgi:hypothetical protein